MADHTPSHATTAIPTRYQGTEFRSRLEARWAAWFDFVGWRWEYEPIDLPGWIPDFILTGETHSLLVEIKPTETVDGFDLGKINTAMVNGGDRREVLLLGRSPLLRGEYDNVLGWLCGPEFDAPPSSEYEVGTWNHWHPACHLTNLDTDQFDLCSEWLSYQGRLTNYYDGNAYSCQYDEIERYWREAGNVTRWNRPKAFR